MGSGVQNSRIMKKYTLKRKFTFIFLHQICTMAMIICIYLYEYMILEYPMKNELYYLLLAFAGGVGGFLSLLQISVIFMPYQQSRRA